ncbi:MAG: phage holin family protein [Thiobacillaceae bacterium]
MSEESPGAGKGLFDSLKGLVAGLVAIAHTRLDLLATDLEEERERLTSVLVLMLVGLFCIGLGTLLLTLLLVVAFWDSHRLLVLAGLTAIFLAGGGTAWAIALHKVKTKPRLFAASLAELAKDRQQLATRS